MFTVVYTLFTLASIVAALVVPRAVPPKSYDSAFLEPYSTYHQRYTALNCENQHGKAFFDTCCHPLLAHQSLDTRPKQCHPSGEEQSGDDDGCGTNDTTQGSKPTTTAHAHGAAHTGPAKTSTAGKSTKTTNGGNGGNNVNTGGIATFFFQNGVPGACGKVHRDSDFICAMDSARYGNSGNASPLCGKQVQITNQKNGRTVTVTVADDCPTCQNGNSIDLSKAAFQQLADLSEGEVPIAWKFV